MAITTEFPIRGDPFLSDLGGSSERWAASDVSRRGSWLFSIDGAILMPLSLGDFPVFDDQKVNHEQPSNAINNLGLRGLRWSIE